MTDYLPTWMMSHLFSIPFTILWIIVVLALSGVSMSSWRPLREHRTLLLLALIIGWVVSCGITAVESLAVLGGSDIVSTIILAVVLCFDVTSAFVLLSHRLLAKESHSS